MSASVEGAKGASTSVRSLAESQEVSNKMEMKKTIGPHWNTYFIIVTNDWGFGIISESNVLN